MIEYRSQVTVVFIGDDGCRVAIYGAVARQIESVLRRTKTILWTPLGLILKRWRPGDVIQATVIWMHCTVYYFTALFEVGEHFVAGENGKRKDIS